MERELYFKQLLKVLMKEPWQKKYKKLLRILFSTEFYWDPAIYSDSSRAEDGIGLRELYFGTDEYNDEPCSVLEMMAALSIRIEQDIMGEPGNDHVEQWFWEMLRNLRLLEEDDQSVDEYCVMKKLNTWMNRDYRANGDGGLFPLKDPYRDQRSVPIWDQMAAYLNERY